MITIKIIDQFGADCNLGDVIIMHFNDRIKFIGELCWNEKHFEIHIDDGETWRPLSEPFQQFERLCPLSDCPALKKEFGRIQLHGKLTINKIYELAQKIS